MASASCLVNGSSAPGPVPKGRVRLYSMRFCPFAQRTRLVLHAKGIEHDIINIHLKDKPNWFLEKNPLGTVPVLETDKGQIIYESPITCEFLDEVYPQHQLFPADPFHKAQQKILLEHFSKVIPLFYKLPMGRSKGDDVSSAEEELKTRLVSLSETLAHRNTAYFGGNSVSMIDYMMWPWFERMDAYGFGSCMEGAVHLKKWVQRMQEDPTIKVLLMDSKTHVAFFQSFLDGKPNYDFGL